MSKHDKIMHRQIRRDETFAELIQGVVPYKKVFNQTPIKKDEQSGIKRYSRDTEDVSWHDHLPTAELLHYKKPGVQDRITRRLKRGTYPVNEELDLHGLRLSEARTYLSHFLNTAQQQRTICILIIHGKGLNSHSAKSVLRPNVRNWLSQDERVLAFTQAPKHLGAEGATYVLLRGARAS
jgi:DNA-nicking Smr family endonuclease